MLKFLEFNIQLFAHKKGQSSTSNGRDSAGRRLGAKAADGELINAGSIIYRQRGTKIHPGNNVGRGTDDTLYATISGYVKYETVGRNKKAIEEYIRNQLQEDIAEDQISLKEYMDPFTGSKNK